MVKRIAVLGSTGSVGRQALGVIADHPFRFQAASLSGYGQVGLLAAQARRFHPKKVAIADASRYRELKVELNGLDIEVLAGESGIAELAADDNTDMVLNALVGFAGLIPTLSSLEAGKAVALANKETLVAGGHLVMPQSCSKREQVIPVDSEHSAIFQCLQGQTGAQVERLILTASGGPFHGCTTEELSSVTVTRALKHPNWEMGAKITVDSATMMNKGLEVIEAHWLFDMPYDKINVLVHRESIIHSMVEFTDGALLAQLGVPEMCIPIQYAFSYPERLSGNAPRVDWSRVECLNFTSPDTLAFPCLELAYEAGRIGGTMPAVLNAANEVAVELFLAYEIGFLDIPRIIESVMNKHKVSRNPGLEELVEVDRLAREAARMRAKMKG